MYDVPKTLEEFRARQAFRKSMGAQLDPATTECVYVRHADMADPYLEFELFQRLVVHDLTDRLERSVKEPANFLTVVSDVIRDLRELADWYPCIDSLGPVWYYYSAQARLVIADIDVPKELLEKIDQRIEVKAAAAKSSVDDVF